MTGTVRQGREGNRWYNARPTPDEFAEWFKTVRLHEGMEHEDFLGGLTLIEQIEKVTEVHGFDEQTGAPKIVPDVRHVAYIPYARIEARIAYFEKYKELHPEWLCLAEPFIGPGQRSRGLPPHFFSYRVQLPGEKEAASIGCSMRVSIYERDTVDFHDVVETAPDGSPYLRTVVRGKLVNAYPPGSKVVATLRNQYEADNNALMKAETGAVARALGFAGMLSFSGVSTAEEVQEALAYQATVATTPEAATLPPDPAVPGVDTGNDPAALRARIEAHLAEMQANFPKALEQFQEWVSDRGFSSLDALTAPQLKGVAKKLERSLDNARLAEADELPVKA